MSAHLPVRAGIEDAEGGAALPGQADCRLTAILRRGRTIHKASLLEFAQDATQIPGIHAELLCYFLGEWLPARSQLVEHPRLAEGIRRIEQALLQGANKACVHAGESAKCRGLIFRARFLPARVIHLLMSVDIVDKVKYYEIGKMPWIFRNV